MIKHSYSPMIQHSHSPLVTHQVFFARLFLWIQYGNNLCENWASTILDLMIGHEKDWLGPQHMEDFYKTLCKGTVKFKNC